MALVGKITVESILLLSDEDFFHLASDEPLLLETFTDTFTTLTARARKLKFNITEKNKYRLSGLEKLITEASNIVLAESGDIVVIEPESELVIRFSIAASREFLFNITETNKVFLVGASKLITEDRDIVLTEDGHIVVATRTATIPRITEDSFARTTEGGETRVVEDESDTPDLVILYKIKARKFLFNITE